MKYIIRYSNQAINDRKSLFNFITFDCGSPITAFRYLQGIKYTIKQLEIFPEIYAIRTNKSLLQYGENIRMINYKKISIIYTVRKNTVYILRIIASSLII